MEVRILGAHNAEAKGLRLVSFLIDDVLVLDAGSITSSLALEEQNRIKAILLTHHHFDHVRDLVTFGANGAIFQDPVAVYGLKQTLDIVNFCLLDGKIYADFSKWPSAECPFLQLKVIQPLRLEVIAGYNVLPVLMNHPVASVGYQIMSSDGRNLFYTGDTGPGLEACWTSVSPDMLFIEVSGPNAFKDYLGGVGHLTPASMEEELCKFGEIKGYLPDVVVVHISPQYQSEIEAEVAAVGQNLGIDIVVGREDLVIQV